MLGSVAVPGVASAANAVQRPVAAPSQSETVDAFYAARDGRPLWFSDFGAENRAPTILADLLRTAGADGLDPDRYGARDLDLMVRGIAAGDAAAVAQADRLLSEAFVAYVRDLKRTPPVDMVWVDPELRPFSPSPRQLLEDIASAPSVEVYLSDMRWMNPIYAGLRKAITSDLATTPAERDALRLNLERARALPGGDGRYIIVNTSTAQLTIYEGGRPVDSMRVVVGKPVYPTPMMAALIRFTSLNPYWNVPPDLAAERIAPNVLKEGEAYLKAKGYQVLSSWDADASVLEPDSIDWKAVADGREQVRIRQLPGPANAMGKMKFMFPNAQGVYLHDTPDKNLLGEETRMFSGGCVRLEDAARLSRWLYEGKPPSTTSRQPEQRVDLPRPVPVFLTYLTAMPGDQGVTYVPDVYNRDRNALAALKPNQSVASR